VQRHGRVVVLAEMVEWAHAQLEGGCQGAVEVALSKWVTLDLVSGRRW
jgi:hypothetical protein